MVIGCVSDEHYLLLADVSVELMKDEKLGGNAPRRCQRRGKLARIYVVMRAWTRLATVLAANLRHNTRHVAQCGLKG